MKITPLTPQKDKWLIDFTLNYKRIKRVIYGTKRMAERAIVVSGNRKDTKDGRGGSVR